MMMIATIRFLAGKSAIQTNKFKNFNDCTRWHASRKIENNRSNEDEEFSCGFVSLAGKACYESKTCPSIKLPQHQHHHQHQRRLANKDRTKILMGYLNQQNEIRQLFEGQGLTIRWKRALTTKDDKAKRSPKYWARVGHNIPTSSAALEWHILPRTSTAKQSHCLSLEDGELCFYLNGESVKPHMSDRFKPNNAMLHASRLTWL